MKKVLRPVSNRRMKTTDDYRYKKRQQVFSELIDPTNEPVEEEEEYKRYDKTRIITLFFLTLNYL